VDDSCLLRYSRQILLPEFGYEGQARLLAARVLIVGMGGLGSPAALYLAAAGVGELWLADDERVELSNLQRQIAHVHARIGQFKVDSARAALRALNPELRVRTWCQRLDALALSELARAVDLVVDASDNFATRFAINRACQAAGIPWVSGAAQRAEGQIAVFSGQPGGPCYRCLYPEDGSDDEAGCAVTGVLAPLVGIVGSVQACEAVKILAGFGTPLRGRLLALDARCMEWRTLRLLPDAACPVCGTGRAVGAHSKEP